MKPVIITICLVLLVPAVCACGAERLVPSQYPTIQAAVNVALSGDTVIIAPGTYTGPGNCDIVVNNSITIRSQDGPETCIIDCNGSGSQPHRGFTLSTGTLAGLTITGGNSSNGGAVICNSDGYSLVKITNCILTGNISKQGGAVCCGKYNNVQITNCSLTNNSSGVAAVGYGGAIYCQYSYVLIANSTISGNSSGMGGGIYCGWSSSMTVINSDISRNRSLLGAGIYCDRVTSSIISDCNIHDNAADANGSNAAGGGIYFSSISSSTLTFTVINSSITNNVVRGTLCQGGGLYFTTNPTSSYEPSVLLTGCVIARNSAQVPPKSGSYSYGGGIYTSGQIKILLSETEVKENSACHDGGISNNQRSVTNISRCRIIGNLAMFGSAIGCYASETALENSVVSGNRPSPLAVDYSTINCGANPLLKITNCTIVGNVQPVIYGYLNPLSSITNSIIYWNSQDPKYNNALPYGLSISYSDIEKGYVGTGNIDADPCFVISGHWDTNGTPYPPYDDFWVEGDYRLTAVSPCIDSGIYALLMDNKDLAGKPRVMGAAIDMGAYENNNTDIPNIPPVAEAGPDQIVYAWIDGNAAVTLDGSKSYDADSNKLSYLWDWTIDGNSYEANGVSPIIKLPVGQHKIELIVNDELENSQPDDVNIMVTDPVEDQLSIIPPIINRQAAMLNILTMLKLPAGITKEQIDSGYKLLLYPGGIEAKTQYITQYWDKGIGRIRVGATFDKSALMRAISTNGNLNLYVVGRLTTGQYFFGQKIIRIIGPSTTSYLPEF